MGMAEGSFLDDPEVRETWEFFEQRRKNSLSHRLATSLRQWQEENALVDFGLGFVPGVGAAQSLADLGASNQLDEPWYQQVLLAIGAIPGVRPARKLISALDDLPPGGLRELIYRLMDEDIVSERQASNMFTSSGDLRMFHGTGDKGLEAFTPEGVSRATLQSRDSWGGPGTYMASNWASPVDMARPGQENTLRILERAVPRDELSSFPVIDFERDSDLPGLLGVFGVQDQTEDVVQALGRLYPQADPKEALRAYNNSYFGTDSPRITPNGRLESPRMEGSTPYDLEDARQRALAAGLRGNFHADSGGVTLAGFAPETYIPGSIYDMPARGPKGIAEAQAHQLARINAVRARRGLPPLNPRTPRGKSAGTDVERLLKEAQLTPKGEGVYEVEFPLRENRD